MTKLLWLAGSLLAAAIILLLATAIVFAQTSILDAPSAAQQVKAGELVILDIRSPQEWAETGVAEGAWPVSMHTPDFPKQLQAILRNIPASQIGLICATGGRSARIAKVFETNGISGISDISEGMFGHAAGPGWVARGLPVVTAQEAEKTYDSIRATWEL